MAAVSGCRESLTWDVAKLSSSKTDLSMIPQKYCIIIRFIGDSYIREWAPSSRDYDMAVMEHDDHHRPRIESTACLIMKQLSEFPDMQETIKRRLISWRTINLWDHLSEDHLDALISYAMDLTTKFTGLFAPFGKNVFNVDIKVTLEHSHTREHDDAIMEQIVQSSIEETVPRMVPATDESIKSLKRKKATSSCEDSYCVICLEEFCSGCEGVLMPCSHTFHGDCIQLWLKTSHYCPICRFKMPTEELPS